MIEELKYFLLGLIQGLAEFFPVSSSGHVVLFSTILDLTRENPLLLSIIVHTATTLSTVIIYRNRIFSIIKGVIRNNKEDVAFFVKILLSSIPIIIAGLLFRDSIELIFNNSTHLIAIMLILTGLVLLIQLKGKREKDSISYYDALLMGVAQAVAIIPGISRSGATISMALLCKIKREKAAEFSFLMVLMPILGISILELIILFSSPLELTELEFRGLLIAFFSSLISGLFACKYMIIMVQNNNLKYFGYYCILIGVIFYFFLL